MLGLHKKNSVEGHGEVQEEEFSSSGEMNLEFSLRGETIGKSVDTPIDQLDKEEKIVSLKVKYEQLESLVRSKYRFFSIRAPVNCLLYISRQFNNYNLYYGSI